MIGDLKQQTYDDSRRLFVLSQKGDPRRTTIIVLYPPNSEYHQYGSVREGSNQLFPRLFVAQLYVIVIDSS